MSRSIVSVQVRIFSLNMLNIIIYVYQLWKKYLLKHSLIKHTTLWRSKLILIDWWNYFYFYVIDNDPIFSSALRTLSVGIFHFCISKPSEFNSMRSLLCVFWFLKSTLICRRWQFQVSLHQYPFSTKKLLNFGK